MSHIEVQGHRIRFRWIAREPATATAEPAPPPLVLIHGAAGSHHVWLEQIAGLGGPLELLVPDLPGHGGSSLAGPPLDIPGHADVLAEMARTLSLPPALWVGHSMGGAIALTLALAHTDRVAGLGLLATGARLPVSEAVLEAAARPDFGDLLAATAYGPDTPQPIRDRYTNGPVPAPPEVVRADFEACGRYDVRPHLASLAVPTLVVGGTADALVGQGRLRQLAAGLPEADLLLLEGAGHMVMQERADAVNAALLRFAKSLATAAPAPRTP